MARRDYGDPVSPGADVDAATRALRSHGVVALPTDTVYGLAVSSDDAEALLRLYRLKGRDADKPVAVLVDSIDAARRLGHFDERALRLATDFWPGPLTIVVPASDAIEPGSGIRSSEGTVGLRWPDRAVIGELVANCGPLVVTSANPSGLPPATTTALVRRYFGDSVDAVIEGGVCDESPSTVVVVGPDGVRVVRSGPVSAGSIEAVIRGLP